MLANFSQNLIQIFFPEDFAGFFFFFSSSSSSSSGCSYSSI